jgi:hypothetical protein
MGATSNAEFTKRGLDLSPPRGEPLPTDTVWFRPSEPVRMRVLLDWQHWERVAREQLFDLTEETTPTNLVPDNDVLLTARLDEDADVPVPTDERDLRERLADPAEPLRATATWTATDVDQRLPLSEDPMASVFDEDDEPRTHAADIEITQISRPRAGAEETTQDGTTEPGDEPTRDESVDVRGLSEDSTDPDVVPALQPVARALDAEGWPYGVTDDGAALSLVATVEDREWEVRVRADWDGWCSIVSIHPSTVSESRREPVAAKLLSYNGTVDRGGFELDDETGVVRFRTPVVPTGESVADALGENVTAMAECYEFVADP